MRIEQIWIFILIRIRFLVEVQYCRNIVRKMHYIATELCRSKVLSQYSAPTAIFRTTY